MTISSISPLAVFRWRASDRAPISLFNITRYWGMIPGLGGFYVRLVCVTRDRQQALNVILELVCAFIIECQAAKYHMVSEDGRFEL